MYRIVTVAAVALGLGLLIGPATGLAGDNDKPSGWDRLAALEKKMANLERIMEIQLDNDAAVNQFMQARVRVDAAARAATLKSQLMTVRSQLELYQIQHYGNYPDLVGKGWSQLTRPTNPKGQVFKPGSKGVGPYLQHAPENPVTGQAKVVGSRKDIGPDAGWFYNQKTGELHAIVPLADVGRHGYSQHDVVTY